MKLPTEDRKFIQIHSSAKKIQSFTSEDFKELYLYLVYICEISGITKPTNNILKYTAEYLRDDYKELALDDVKLAFKMAFSYKLDIDDLNNYGTLNIIWVGKILQSYIVQRNKSITNFELEKYKLDFEKSLEISDVEIDDIMATSVVKNYTIWKTTNDFSDLGNSTYNFLLRKKIIDFDNETKHKLMVLAKEKIKTDSMNPNISLFMRSVISLKNDIPLDTIKIVAKDLCVIEFFKKVSITNDDIGFYLADCFIKKTI